MTAFRRPAQDPTPKPEMFRRVKAIVGAALDCAESDRDHHLDEACAGDEALRLEVESLLDATQGGETFRNAGQRRLGRQHGRSGDWCGHRALPGRG